MVAELRFSAMSGATDRREDEQVPQFCGRLDAKFAEWIQCLKDNGFGELPEELGQEALDNYFDMRKGKAESILDYIFRAEILTVALKKDTASDLDEKIRGYWLMRTSNLTEREISGIKILTQDQTQLAQVKKAITQTIVANKREEVRDDL